MNRQVILPTEPFSNPAWRALTKDAQLVYGHLWQTPHRNTEGLFWYPLHSIASGLGSISVADIERAIGMLTQRGYIEYDHDAEVVLDLLALRYHRPAGPKQLQGAVTAVVNTPLTHLLLRLLEVAKELAPDFERALAGEYEYEYNAKRGRSSEKRRLRGDDRYPYCDVPSMPLPDTVSDTPSGYPIRYPGVGIGVGIGVGAQDERSSLAKKPASENSNANVTRIPARWVGEP